ncbi:MAG: acyl-CoA dehydratase activase, partial [Polyangia bacterium]|nr:acyl-CoA dehydratase activase [Polyangia bacterium]
MTPSAMIVAGLDVGSGYSKAVLLGAGAEVLGRGVAPTGHDFAAAADKALSQALEEAGATREALGAVMATGYGRANVPLATATRTEIDCHARGAYHHVRRAITVVDIGGQDNKVIRLDARGRRMDFSMNRKCAAGTGAFLEELAFWLRIEPGEMARLAERSTSSEVRIGSYCTVFARTEVLARLREGAKVEDLARAAYESVARRVLETRAMTGEVALTGGVVAHNPHFATILGRVLGAEVLVPPFPQHTGALGAALAALEPTGEDPGTT